MRNQNWSKTPAVVKYIGKSNNNFTTGKEYFAFFLEYWQGKRESLHVQNNEGKITDFNPFSDFEIVKDEDNVLNKHEAIVRCVTKRFQNELFEIKYDKIYKAIGADENGYYLVMDESYDCYFYPSTDFEIIEDEHNILSCCSLYYNFK